MVNEYFNQEEEYREFLATGLGFVCNNLGFAPESHRIHRSDCNMLNRAGPAKFGLHTSVKKACSRDLGELVAWVTARYGPEPRGFAYCAFCLRGGAVAGSGRP
jgi:hypothetical protein